MTGGIISTVVLPWPPSALRPNASSPGNWRRKSEAAKRYKRDCILLTPKSIADGTHLAITFRPPDKRRRDLDNMLASFKAGIDAIAQVMGVDDYRFSISLARGEPIKGGQVVVCINHARECGEGK
jgi:crossover junction endodeoxyribonuclease RusA